MVTIENTVLVIIDVQEKLFRVMSDKELMLENLQKMVKGTNALGIPIILTEQNPRGLGTTLPEIAGLLVEVQPITKMSFSCLGEKPFSEKLKTMKRKQVLLTGIEAHVCVYQTALDLLKLGYEVHSVTDCITSRIKENKAVALQLLSSQGVRVTSVEMVLFELLKTAAHPKFKEISGIVK